MKLNYIVKVNTDEGVRTFQGSAELSHVLRLRLDFPEGSILSAKAELQIGCSSEDRCCPYTSQTPRRL